MGTAVKSLVVLFLVFAPAGTVWAREAGSLAAYPAVAGIDSRLAVWIAAQLHLMYAAFVLAVPMFALFIELLGWRARQRHPAEARRYDWLAHEMASLLPVAYSLTAITGALLGFLLFIAYPEFMNYLTGVFGPTFVIYPLFFVAETLCLYFWYYGWERLQGERKWIHLWLGLLLNICGTIVVGSAGVPMDVISAIFGS